VSGELTLKLRAIARHLHAVISIGIRGNVDGLQEFSCWAELELEEKKQRKKLEKA